MGCENNCVNEHRLKKSKKILRNLEIRTLKIIKSFLIDWKMLRKT